MEQKTYNLRSKKAECSIPIQLQLASDEDFMAALRPSTSGQVFGSDHADSSDSDIDISELINHSDQNLSDPVIRGEVFTGGGQVPDSPGGSSDSVSQNDINRQILQQLTSLGDRLSVIEGTRPKTHKKTSDAKLVKTSHKVKCAKGAVPQSSPSHQQGGSSVGIASNHIPTPDKLQQEAYIQREVQARLLHLADRAKAGDKIKSQRGGSVDVFVSKRVKWPHEYVLAGQSKDRISYNQLSPIQWMVGFCRSIKEESDSKIKEHMLDYCINLLEDATDFSWSSAKASHAVLLCRMEQGGIASWQDTDKIDRVRRAHAQRHANALASGNRSDRSNNNNKSVPCVYYNKNSCGQKSTHETKGVLYRHICSYCWSKDNKQFAHPQSECRKSQGHSKNE